MKIQDVNNSRALANLLRCESEFLTTILSDGFLVIKDSDNLSELLRRSKFDRMRIVHTFSIPKRNINLGYRTIFTPFSQPLSDTLKILNSHLSNLLIPIENVHGFVRGRNIKTHATSHLAKDYVLSLDIKDYFESISAERIESSLTEIGLDAKVAKWISMITTIDGRLVQGFHTSPTIANIVTRNLDIELNSMSGNKTCYTRYADDMYFSSNSRIPEMSLFKTAVKRFGFTINDAKTQLMVRGRKQYVTGLTVFDSVSPRISKRVKRNLRLEIHFITKFGYRGHVLKRMGLRHHQLRDPIILEKVIKEVERTRLRIWGWIHFIKSIEPSIGERFELQLKEGNKNRRLVTALRQLEAK